MMKKIKLSPNNNEIIMSDNDFIVSKTDVKGTIIYCNEIFMEIAGYKEKELLGINHNIIRHPDMPRVAFALAWDLISKGKEFLGFVKNLKKDGGYYWVFANITADYDSSGKIIGYTSVRRKPSKAAIDSIIPIYEKLLKIEKQLNMEASKKYLFDLLETQNISYDEFVLSLQNVNSSYIRGA